MIRQLARYQVRPEALEQCLAAIHEFVAYVRAREPGTLRYDVWQEQADRTRFVHLFEFRDAEADRIHSESAEVKKFASILYPNCLRPVEFVDYDQVASNSEKKNIVLTPDAPRSPLYSQAVKAAGLIFVAGQGPFDPATGEVQGESIQEQTRQCLRNVEAILRVAGSSLDQVVSATFILANEDDFAGMNEEWARWFPANAPARQGAKLPIRFKGIKVSIAVIAEA